MKKKIGLSFLVFLELVCILGIYAIRGQVGPWVWSACIFVFAPMACIALAVQVVWIAVRVVKSKSVKWNLLYSAILLLIAYPITILFGVSALTYPLDASAKGTVEMINPIENSILLGGANYKTHAIWASECFAYDVLKEPYDIGSDHLEDYGIYLAEVYSPVSGTVIAVNETEENIKPNTEEFESSLGNYIFMEIDQTGTYLILAHLEKGSINAAVGDHVTQSEILAKVGNSGTTSEPHLHMQHQRNNPLKMKPSICAEGLPIKFIEKK